MEAPSVAAMIAAFNAAQAAAEAAALKAAQTAASAAALKAAIAAADAAFDADDAACAAMRACEDLKAMTRQRLQWKLHVKPYYEPLLPVERCQWCPTTKDHTNTSKVKYWSSHQNKSRNDRKTRLADKRKIRSRGSGRK